MTGSRRPRLEYSSAVSTPSGQTGGPSERASRHVSGRLRRPRRRLLVALLFGPDETREIDGLRRALGAGSLERIAPHITLVPPLNVPESDVVAVLDHLRVAAATTDPLPLELGPPATFWPATPVLYLGVRPLGARTESLAALRGVLVSRDGPLAPPPGREERLFVPHVTLHQAIGESRLATGLQALADYVRPTVVDRLSLLGQDDEHRWEEIGESRLGRAVVVGRGGLALELTTTGQLDPISRAHLRSSWGGVRDPGLVRDGAVPFAVLARREGHLVGLAEGSYRDRVATLSELVVAPHDRRRGVGRALLAGVESVARAEHCPVVRVLCPRDGTASAFFVAHGYAVLTTAVEEREARDLVVLERSFGSASGRSRQDEPRGDEPS